MTRTFADDVRMVLAEVAPELASRIYEHRLSWGYFRTVGWLTRDEYEYLHRACDLVTKQRGMPHTRCIDCRWAVYVAQDPGVAPSPCPHIGETT